MATRNLNRYLKQGIAGLTLAAAVSLPADAQFLPTSADTANLPATTASSPIIPAAVNAKTVGLPSIADLVASVSPAVVNVIARTSDGQTTSEGQGSGFIISPAGEVVTNFHVIEGATNISIAFGDGTEYPVSIMGMDEETDLAVLKIPVSYTHLTLPTKA